MVLFRTILLFFCLLPLAYAAPVGTQFTYQGKLEDNNAPANGLYDFEFRLFDQLTDGNQIGSVQSLAAIPVENGVFSVTLNFGAFGSDARWLSIAVRPAGAAIYETLVPRQAVTAAPVAQFALSGNAGPQGPAGAQGPAGPQGAAGVVQIATVAGLANAIPATPMGSAPWFFWGPFTTVSVSAGQRITGSGSASIFNGFNTSVTVSVSLCLSTNADGATLEPFFPSNFPDATVLPQPTRTMVSANGSRVVAQAGTYRVGLCVRNKSTTIPLPSTNDYANAWFMVTN
jgi:hypothetical protein